MLRLQRLLDLFRPRLVAHADQNFFGDEAAAEARPGVDRFTDAEGREWAVFTYEGGEYDIQPLTDAQGNHIITRAPAGNDPTAAGNLAARWAELANTQANQAAELALQQQQLLQAQEQFNANLGYLQDKLRLDELNNDRNARIATEGLLIQERARVDANVRSMNEIAARATEQRNQLAAQFAIAEYQTAAAEREGALSRNFEGTQNAAQRAFQAVQAHLDRTIRVAEVNATLRTQNVQQRIEANQQLLQAMQNPGDIVAVAAYLFSPEGQQEAAVSDAVRTGQSFVTDRSLNPIASNLRLQDELARGPQLIAEPRLDMTGTTYNPEAVPDRPTLPNLNTLLAAAPRPVVPPPPPGAGGDAEAIVQAQGIQTQGAGLLTQDNPNIAGYGATEAIQALQAAATAQAAAGTTQPPIYAAEGLNAIVSSPTPIVAGEGGRPEQVTITPLDASATPQIGQAAPAAGDPYITRARTLLATTAQRALANLGLSGVPTPASQAAPGSSPYLQALSAYIAQSILGVPTSLYQEEIDRLRPQGVTVGQVVRTG